MLTELYIENYRGIENLVLDRLGKINIIAGANNTGKTSILEVIESLQTPNNLMAWRKIGRREGNTSRVTTTVYDTMKSLFPISLGTDGDSIVFCGKNNDKEFQVILTSKCYDTLVSEEQLNALKGIRDIHTDTMEADTEYETKVMELGYFVDGLEAGKDIVYSIQRGLPMRVSNRECAIIDNIVYISPTQHAQGMFFLDSLLTDPELYEQFVEIMRQFDPDFISVNSVEEEKSFGRKYVVLSKNHKEGLLLNAYGDGMKKAMLLLSAVLKAKDGILLLDEFETAIHMSAMKNVFDWILKTADKLNVQIFMTSHSIEAIETVLKCCPDVQEDMRMLTLVKAEEGIKVRNIDAKKAIQLLDVYGLELR